MYQCIIYTICIFNTTQIYSSKSRNYFITYAHRNFIKIGTIGFTDLEVIRNGTELISSYTLFLLYVTISISNFQENATHIFGILILVH